MKRNNSQLYFGGNNLNKRITKNKVEAKKNNDDEDNESEKIIPFPKLFQNEDKTIYIKENHLFFHTDINQDSVDEVKKLMREYALKISGIKKSHTCVEIKSKPLILHIYSYGGDVHSGFSLYDFIIEYKKNIDVYTVVEGLAASAATIISIAGNKRYITPNSYMLIHQLSTFMMGNFEQLKDEFNNCEKIMAKIIEIYKSQTKITVKKIPKILKHDLIWDAQECLKNGLVDEIKVVDLFNDDFIDEE